MCSFHLSPVLFSDVLILSDLFNVYLPLVPSCDISRIRVESYYLQRQELFGLYRYLYEFG